MTAGPLFELEDNRALLDSSAVYVESSYDLQLTLPSSLYREQGMLYRILGQSMTTHRVYTVYQESKAQLKSWVRSHRGMLKPYRKLGIFQPQSTHEVELPVSDTTTLFLGIAQIKRTNLAQQNIPLPNLAFFYLVPSKQRSFRSNRTDFLRGIGRCIRTPERLATLDFVGLDNLLLTETRGYLRSNQVANGRTIVQFHSAEGESELANRFRAVTDSLYRAYCN